MEFARPNTLYALAVVPALAILLVYGERRKRAELFRFLGTRLCDTLAPGRSWRKNLLKGLLKTAGFALIVLTIAGPRFGSQLVKVEREGIDLVIALDTSLSMLAEDMLPNRLERAKLEIIDLIRGLKGDRVGLVVFAGDAFALCPLTVDYDAALMFARSVDVDVVSEPGTAIDKAVQKSGALFDESSKRDRAIILVTDGENHEGDPEKSAREAGEKGIRIFTIGIGNPAGDLIPERGTGGSVAGYKKDKRGETVLTRLDEKTLQMVAAASGGKYLPATREGLELKVLYNEIAGMDRKIIKGEFIERKKERFWIFLAGALLFLVLEALISSKALRAARNGRLLHTGVLFTIFACVLLAPVAPHAKTVDAGKVKSGNVYYQAGEYDKAMTLYLESLGDTLKLPNHHQGVFYNQGNTLCMQEKYKEAIEHYQKSYSEDSTLTGQMLYNRGNALLKSGNFGAAVESYVQALQYFPDDRDVLHNLELALKMLQQQEQQKQDQSGDQNQDDGEKSENDRSQQGDDQQQGQENGEQQPQEPEEQQQEQDELQPDSTQAAQPQADSSAVPELQLSPEDMMKLSVEDAIRILQTLEEQEKKLQRERHKAAFRRLKKSGKDW